MMTNKRSIKIKLSDLIIVIALTISIIFSINVLISLTFGGVEPVHKINDYSEILNSAADAPFKKLVENGFTKLENDIQSMVNLSNLIQKDSYLCVDKNDEVQIIVDGNLHNAPKNATIKYGKYTFIDKNTSKIGLKNLTGEVIIEPRYDNISFHNDAAIASIDGVNRVYYNNEMVFECSQPAFICRDSSFVGINDGTYTNFLNLSDGVYPYKPPILASFPNLTLLEPFKNAFIVYDKSKDLIGFTSENSILLEPMFKTVDFDGKNGNAYANSENYYIEYQKGAIKAINLKQFGLENARISSFNDGYAVFYDTNLRLFGVINTVFEIVVPPIFQNINEIVFNGYIFDNKNNAIYSIESKNYVVDAESITFHNDFCVIATDKSYQILNNNLTTMIECDFAFYSEPIDTLFVIYNNRLHQFKHKKIPANNGN